LKRHVAAWRMANVDDLCNLRYESGGITRGRHSRRLHYKIMSCANGFNLVLSVNGALQIVSDDDDDDIVALLLRQSLID